MHPDLHTKQRIRWDQFAEPLFPVAEVGRNHGFPVTPGAEAIKHPFDSGDRLPLAQHRGVLD